MKVLNYISLILIVIGAINWGLVGFFNFNLITYLFANEMAQRVIYAVVGLAGLWSLSFFAKAHHLCHCCSECSCCGKSGKDRCKRD